MNLRRATQIKGVVTLDDYVELELFITQKGWRCSGCGLYYDATGRPRFGNEHWYVETDSVYWTENEPQCIYCPKCGKRIKRRTIR